MLRKPDQWTTALTAVLLVGALLACKKKAPDDTTAPSASVAAAPTPPASAPTAAAPDASAAAPDGAKLGEVKRYPDKEKAQTGAARVLQDGVKVYDEADDKTDDVATLDKGLLVFRLASVPDYELVEFPSGVGKVSPGWVPAKALDTTSAATVNRDAVAAQAKTAVVKAVSSAAPKTSAAASVAKPATSASSAATIASAKAATAASAAAAAAASAQAVADKLAADAAKAKKAADKAAAKAVKASSKP